MNAENSQGRARGLYDEQLQRQRQEKMLLQDGKQTRCRRAVVPSGEVQAHR